MSNVENFLEHYGVKGMKWGVRKRSSSSSTPSSDDAKKVAGLRSTVKSSRSTDPLSNSDLKAIVERMNLEQQYSRLAAGQRSAGAKFVSALLGNVAKTQTTRLANDYGNEIGDLLKKKAA